MKKTNFILVACAIAAASRLMPMEHFFSNFEDAQDSEYLSMGLDNFPDDIFYRSSNIPLVKEYTIAMDYPALPDTSSTPIMHTIAKKAGLERFPCPICDMSISTKGNLKKHINNIHNGIKPYACDVDKCNKRYAEKNDLKLHKESIHEGIKRHKCPHPDCSKSFTLNKDAKKHYQSMHTTLKPYICTECGSSFANRCRLTKHTIRWHSDAKPYKCSPCNQAFKTTTELKTHCTSNKHNKRVNILQEKLSLNSDTL